MKLFFLPLLLLCSFGYSQVSLKWGLQAYYSFDGNANDQSGNKNHPVFNNATLTADRFGYANSAYHFNGRNAYMKILNSASLNTANKLSISAWIRPMGFYEGKCHGNSVLMKGDADYLYGNYFLRFEDGPYTNYNNCHGPVDKMHQNFYGPEAHAKAPGYKPYIKANQWYHVAVTFDGTTASLYIDCKLVAANPQNGAGFTNKYDLYLGKLNNAAFPYWFNGDLDELRIYNRPLNSQEIQALCRQMPSSKPTAFAKKIDFVGKKPKQSEKKSIVETKAEPKPAVAEPKTLSQVAPSEKPTGNKAEIQINPFKEIKLEERRNELIKEIVVDQDSISVTLYDNGTIDGDSVTLIFNDKILTTHQLLSEKPVTFYIKIAPGNSRNELVMYAENLGSIPPNTALMVIYDGEKRYELNVSSSKTSNGVVSFKLKEPGN